MTTTIHPAAPAIPHLPLARVLIARYRAHRATLGYPDPDPDPDPDPAAASAAYTVALETAAAALGIDVERLDLLLLDAITSAQYGAAPSDGPSAVTECAAALLALAIPDEEAR
jgi:hypothetical protein